MKHSLKIILFVLSLYLFIYSPPFKIFPVNVSLLFAIPAYFSLIKNKRVLTALAQFKIELFLLMGMLIYSFLIAALNFTTLFFFMNNLFILFAVFPTCVWFYFLFEDLSANKDFDLKQLSKYLIIIAVSAAIISIIIFFVPELRNYVNFSLLKYDEGLLEFQQNRAFGIADELLYSYAIVQGLILFIFIYFSERTILNIVFFILIFISIILNARIGFIPLLFLPLLMFKSKESFFKSLMIIAVIIIALPIIYNFLDDEYKDQVEFTIAFFDQTSDLLLSTNKASDSNYDILLNDMFVLPNDIIGWLFGSGENIFLSPGKNTDIGYLLLLNFGGLVYFVLFSVFMGVFITRFFKHNRKYVLISIVILTVLLAANFKGLFFAPKPGLKIILLLYVFVVLKSKRNEYILNQTSQVI